MTSAIDLWLNSRRTRSCVALLSVAFHQLSKTTSSFDYGTKSTNNTGAHTHSISGTANSAGAHQHKSSGAFGGTNTSIFPNGYTAISNLSEWV